MCKEQEHVLADLAARPVLHKGEFTKRFIGARNWSMFHDPIVEYQRALSVGFTKEHPEDFVFDILFACVTLRYQGFRMVREDRGDLVFTCFDTEFTLKKQFIDDFRVATSYLVNSVEVFDFSGLFVAWYTHRVARFEPMPHLDQLWSDMIFFSEGIWPEISDYEVNFNGDDRLFGDVDVDTIVTFLETNEFDVYGNQFVRDE